MTIKEGDGFTIDYLGTEDESGIHQDSFALSYDFDGIEISGGTVTVYGTQLWKLLRILRKLQSCRLELTTPRKPIKMDNSLDDIMDFSTAGVLLDDLGSECFIIVVNDIVEDVALYQYDPADSVYNLVGTSMIGFPDKFYKT